MATPGQEKAFVVESQGVSYSLQLDINGMCELEDKVSKDEGARVTFQQVVARIDDGDMRALRLIVWSTLLHHHPEADLTLAGQIATDVLQSGQVYALIDKAVAGATPAPADTQALGLATRNPRKAQTNRKDGTGPRSTAPRAGTA